MPSTCIVPGCYGSKVMKPVHSFPRNEQRKKWWVDRIAHPSVTFSKLTRNSRICDRHFTEDQHELNRQDGLKRLKHDALPSVFDHLPKKSGREKPKRLHAVGVAPTQTVALRHVCEHNYTAAPSSSQSPQSGLQHNASGDIETERNIQPDIPGDPNERSNPASKCQNCKILEGKIQELREEIKYLKDLSRKKDDAKASLIAGIDRVFSEDQISAMRRGGMRGQPWSDSTIMKGLDLHSACGTSGYQLLLEMGLPFPSIRSLQHKVQQNSPGVHLSPEILNPIFDPMES